MSVEMKQLQKFLEWELDHRPDCSDRKHVVQWAIDHIRDLEAQLARVRSALHMAGRLAIDERWDQRFPKVFGEMEAALEEKPPTKSRG